MIGAIIGGATSLVNTATNWINSGRDRRAAEKNAEINFQRNQQLANEQYAHNKDMAQFQFDKNYQMWQEQNAYNSPESQMQRFKDAGLNPNLMYGQGTAGNATSSPTYQSPSYERPSYNRNVPATQLPQLGNFQNILSTAINMDNAKKQGALINSQVDNIQSKTLRNNVNYFNDVVRLNRGSLDFETAKQLQKYQIDAAKWNLEKTLADIDYTRTSRENLMLDSQLKNFEIDLNRRGITKSDNALMRIGNTLFNGLGLGDFFDKYGKHFRLFSK